MNFGEAPLVPREELPAHLQPQNSIRGKIINYMNGIDPRLPSRVQEQTSSARGKIGVANLMDAGDVELQGNQQERQEAIEEQKEYFAEQDRKLDEFLEKNRLEGEIDGERPEIKEIGKAMLPEVHKDVEAVPDKTE